MNTNDFTRFLAVDAGPAETRLFAKRFGPVVLGGFLLSAAVAVALIGFAPAARTLSMAFWIKMAYGLALVASAGWLINRLCRPGLHAAGAACVVALVVAAMGLAGVATVAMSPASQQPALLFGTSWWMCPWAILALSLPTLGGIFWSMGRFAPTRPRLAGFIAGVLAGAVGALGYAFACVESSAAFVAIWYSAGVLITGVIGSLAGPRLLRW